MTLTAIKKNFEKLIAQVHAIDGIVLTLGICSLVVGILVDVFILRLLCLMAVVFSAVLVYLSLRTKRSELHPGMESTHSLFPSQFSGTDMKKLVFDDFQSQSGDRYMIGEVHQEDAVREITDTTLIQSANNSRVAEIQKIKVLKPEVKPVIKEFQVSDFFDVDSDIFMGDSEPRTEFDFLLNKVLGAIKEVLFAHSVVFFWANREKNQMVMEARITDGSNFMTSRRFSMGHDLISKIAMSGKPELIDEVNQVSEHELLPYYEAPELVHSFVGAPVFFSRLSNQQNLEHPVAVIAADSKAEDAFGQETLLLLGQFTKLISALIKSYTDKYDLLVDSELLRSIRRMQAQIRGDFSVTAIGQSLAAEASKLVHWDFLSIVLYDEQKRAWIAKKVTTRAHEGYIVTEQIIDFPETIVGRTIKNNLSTSIENLESATFPRYYLDEKLEARGSFVSIPISSFNKCYGALNVESREIYNFSRQDIEVLSRLVEHAASALEILYMNELIKEYVIIDDLTGVYSKKFFLQKMDEELQRADDCGTELSLLFITLDKSNEIINRFGHEGLERVMVTLAKAIRASVNVYDIVGRFDGSRFGVLLVNTAANEAYLWAEKIRKNVAVHIINLEGKTFSITVSLGVCGALEGMRKEELLGNTTTVLNKATEAGGNAVRVF